MLWVWLALLVTAHVVWVAQAISYDVVNLPLTCNTEAGMQDWVLSVNHFEVHRWEEIVLDQLRSCLDVTEVDVDRIINSVAAELHRMQYIGGVPLFDTNSNSSYYPLYDDVHAGSTSTRYRWRIGTQDATATAAAPGIDCKHAVSKLFRAAVTNSNVDRAWSIDISDTLAFKQPVCFNHLPSYQSNPLVDVHGLVAEQRLGAGAPEGFQPGQVLFESLFGGDEDGVEEGGSGTVRSDDHRQREETAGRVVPWLRKSRIPALFRNNGRRRFIVLQSRGTNTGGTIALNDVYKTLVHLGYDAVSTDSRENNMDRGAALLCNEGNYGSAHCSASGDGEGETTITGEKVCSWCLYCF
jgi:hypothetical protein